MERYYNPETEEEITVVKQIQVRRWREFSEFGEEMFEPQFALEGGKFPDNYAIPESLAKEVQMSMHVDPSDHGITVVNTDKLKRM